MKKLLILLSIVSIAFGGVPQVPQSMEYCGMTLNFTQSGRAAIQKHVNKLHENKLYLKLLVEKADLYMPYVSHAMEVMHVPQDLKYIVLQESALQGDAVSSSNAVGFWQFKDFTAKEVGLTINKSVDERKHIFLSSVGAARYFSMNFLRHPNWVYSVISYYAGGTGAIPYINTKNYGAKEMQVDEKLHWYAQKAIAHKIAFQDMIQQNPKPGKWLKPVSTEGETSVWRLAKKHKMEVADLRKLNLWITASPLPKDYQGSLYLPVEGAEYAFVKDPMHSSVEPELETPGQSEYYAALARKQLEPKPINKTEEEKAPTPEDAENSPVMQETKAIVAKYRDLPEPYSGVRTHFIAKEPMMGKEFALITRNFKFKDIAGQFNIAEEKLRKYNGLGIFEEPKAGQLIWLIPPKKASVFVAPADMPLAEISKLVRKPLSRLAIYNHMNEADTVKKGRKLYLRVPRPGEEPIIVYTFEDERIDLSKR